MPIWVSSLTRVPMDADTVQRALQLQNATRSVASGLRRHDHYSPTVFILGQHAFKVFPALFFIL